MEAALSSCWDRLEEVGTAWTPSSESHSSCFPLQRIAGVSTSNAFMWSSSCFVGEIAVDLRHGSGTLRSAAFNVCALSRGRVIAPGSGCRCVRNRTDRNAAHRLVSDARSFDRETAEQAAERTHGTTPEQPVAHVN